MTSKPPLITRKKKLYSYQVLWKSNNAGDICRLILGPKGMRVLKGGLVTWKVPANWSKPKAVVIIEIKNPDGRVFYHSFEIRIED